MSRSDRKLVEVKNNLWSTQLKYGETQNYVGIFCDIAVDKMSSFHMETKASSFDTVSLSFRIPKDSKCL